jgi:hypothetical protein
MMDQFNHQSRDEQTAIAEKELLLRNGEIAQFEQAIQLS